jgi:hypothetical protein
MVASKMLFLTLEGLLLAVNFDPFRLKCFISRERRTWQSFSNDNSTWTGQESLILIHRRRLPASRNYSRRSLPAPKSKRRYK